MSSLLQVFNFEASLHPRLDVCKIFVTLSLRLDIMGSVFEILVR